MSEAKKLKFVYNVKAKWAKNHNSRKITQCHNCQGHGHGSSACSNLPKCLQCDGDHVTRECNRDKSLKPICANCKGEHRAKSASCPMYLERLEVINKLQKKKRKGPRGAAKPSSAPVEQSTRPSWPMPSASRGEPPFKPTGQAWPALKGTKNTFTATTMAPEKIKEFMELNSVIREINEICDVGKLLQLAKNLRDTLKTCSSQSEQQTAILTTCMGSQDGR